jgi:pyridoxine kinase
MKQARILAISSQVTWGPVGNSAAVPAMQARGHEVLAIPTIILSNHPGPGPLAGFRTAATDLAAMLEALEQRGVLQSCAAVMTGYFAAAGQIHAVAPVLGRMKARNGALCIVVDPIIGDGAELYVPLAVAEAIRDRLVPLADCLTPNCFELEWLTGRRVTNRGDAISAARALGPGEILATSIPEGAGRLATLAITAAACAGIVSPLKQRVPHGTGDFLAGLYLVERLNHGPEQALARAMIVLDRAIELSAGSAVLDVAGALHGNHNQ